MILGTAQEITKLPFLIKSLTWRDKPTRPTVKTTSGFKLIAFKESNAGALETIPDPTHWCGGSTITGQSSAFPSSCA